MNHAPHHCPDCAGALLRDFIINTTNQKKVKIPRMVRMHSSEMVDIEEASAGDIVALFGVDCASGDTFTDGTTNVAMSSMFIPEAVISLAVAPKSKDAASNLSKALQKFRKEDPTFRVSRDEESNETIIAGMGELHLEIYIERMKREFNSEVIAGKPQVAYRETISRLTDFDYTHKKQTGGSGQYAKVVGTIEPLQVEEGKDPKAYEFEDKVVGGRIPKEFIPAVDEGFQEQMVKGPLIGFPIVGMKVTLKDGAYHDVDSSYLAFKIASMAALREVYMQAGPVALEPIMKLEAVAHMIADTFGKKNPARKVTPFIASLVWRLEKIKCGFTGQLPLVTRETAATALARSVYDNSKLKQFLPFFAYRPIEETIAATCAVLQQKLNNR